MASSANATSEPVPLLVKLFRGGRLHRWAMTLITRRVEKRLLPILGGPVFFEIARVACRLDLFGLLRRTPGLTFEEIRQQLNLAEEPARILLSGCVTLKLIRQRRGRYRTSSQLTARPLDAAHEPNLVVFMEWMHHIVAPSMQYFEQALKEEHPAGLQAFPGDEPHLYGRLSHDPQRRDIFYEAMNARTRMVNEMFIKMMDFSKVQRILDVGGGDGEVLAAIATAHPHIEGTVVEVPGVAEQAEERFRNAKLDDRLSAISADMFSDALPAGHDCLLFCHVLANHGQDRNRDLLKRAFAALDPGGLVGIYGAFMDDDLSGPLSSAMLSAYFYCTVSGGRHYSRAESESWVRDAGFVDISRMRIMHNHGVILARKP